MVCNKCGLEAEPIKIPRPDIIHDAELRCRGCEASLGWQKKEKNEGNCLPIKFTADELGIQWCQLCRPWE